MAGVFEIFPTVACVQQSGTWAGGLVGTWLLRTNADLLTAINQHLDVNLVLGSGKLLVGDPSAVGSHLVRFNFSLTDPIISLDGNPAISFNDLPAGFEVTSATLIVASRSSIVTAGSQLFLQQNAVDELLQAAFVGGNNDLAYQFPYDFSGPVDPTMLDILSNGYGIRTVYTGAGDVAFFDHGRITGTYDTFAFTYTLDPPDGSDVDAGNDDEGGNLITIASAPGNPLDLSHVTISVACGPITIVEQTASIFKFYLPILCNGAGPTDIMATGDGTQFSGSVSLGTLNILLTNASGIYTLVPGKTNDTLYSSLRDGTTRNVKIPNPFAKTGFIGG